MSLIDIKGKNAIVTGASSGIGEKIAEYLAKEGCHVALVARSEEKLKKLAENLKQFGVNAYAFPCDLQSKNDIDKTVEAIGKEFKTVHILVNNAGIGGDKVPATEEQTEKGESVADMWERVIQVNLLSYMRFTNKTLRYMKDAKEGSIVAISSLAATHTAPKSSQYMASKHGVKGFMGCLFEDVRELGIKAIEILPGYVNTPMLDDNESLDTSKMIQPEDIAYIVVSAIKAPATCCPTEIRVRPQFSPYKKQSN